MLVLKDVTGFTIVARGQSCWSSLSYTNVFACFPPTEAFAIFLACWISEVTKQQPDLCSQISASVVALQTLQVLQGEGPVPMFPACANVPCSLPSSLCQDFYAFSFKRSCQVILSKGSREGQKAYFVLFVWMNEGASGGGRETSRGVTCNLVFAPLYCTWL